ncbi:sulfotransferase domain-containing protein [Gammaproteobacteria bacterium]|nr:sulfotransferase domain-containing protein [Gammaproteobacteria bacterium]
MNLHEASEPYVSENITKKAGWGDTEYDEFEMPFQWIGRQATISVQLSPASSILHIYAGSPDFPGIRNISISASNIEQTRQISPGWKAYQFDLSPASEAGNSVLDVSIGIDTLLDIREDPRELGIMVRKMECRRHPVELVESNAIPGQRNIERRLDYYSSSGAPGVLWLASFPRSGNTWMRFLLTNLLFDRVEESSLVAEYIDEIIDPLYVSRRPGTRDITVFGSESAHIMKTHMPFNLSLPLRDKTVGAIYILRNPLDIAVSLRKRYWHHYEDFSEQFLIYGTDRNIQMRGYGSWHSHVFSWLHSTKSTSTLPVLFVKFEELIADPFSVCTRVLDWLNVERDSQRIRRAIEHSSIENLRKMEADEIASETPGIFFALEQKSQIEAGRRFLADGKSDNYRNYLTESEIRKGLATFGPIMKELNYI